MKSKVQNSMIATDEFSFSPCTIGTSARRAKREGRVRCAAVRYRAIYRAARTQQEKKTYNSVDFYSRALCMKGWPSIRRESEVIIYRIAFSDTLAGVTVF